MKAAVKHIILKLGLGQWLNTGSYFVARWRNRKPNLRFRACHPEMALPPDEWLHETFQLNYSRYTHSGLTAAAEMREWSSPWLHSSGNNILDWGAGAGRVCRHLPQVWPGQYYYACDPNAGMVEWNHARYPLVRFALSGHRPPLPYQDKMFQLVFGFSVLTHIEEKLQQTWLQELHRVLHQDGVLILTTQGTAYEKKLTGKQKRLLESAGIITVPYSVPGHRMVSAYHAAVGMQRLLAGLFTVVAFYEGLAHPEKTGGQDLWILKKNSN